MSTIGERISQIIQAKCKKKVEFARILKIDQSYVTQLENGRRNPSKRLIDDICREFGVNETWLRTGEGEMYMPLDSITLDELVNREGLNGREAEMAKKFVQLYLSLAPKTRQDIMNRFDEIFGGNPSQSPEAPSSALEKAQKAANLTGESVDEFVARAVETQARQDKATIATGINPATNRDRWAQRKNPHDMTEEEMVAEVRRQFAEERRTGGNFPDFGAGSSGTDSA